MIHDDLETICRESLRAHAASAALSRAATAASAQRQALRARAPMIGLTTYAEDEMHDDAVSTAVADRTAGGVAELGTILGIWAHPDDEAYLSGGLMAMARDNGSRVVCVTATRGELGTPDPVAWPPHRLATARTGELARCLEILGVTEHHWLGYRDGECATVHAADAVAQLCGVIGRVGPDTVLTFGPDGITGPPDHQAVSAWTAAAFDRAAPSGARLLHAAVAQRRAPRWSALNEKLDIFPPGYPITTPAQRLAVDLVLDPDTAARKVRALAAQATQTAGLIAAMGVDCYTAWVGDESFVEAAAAPDRCRAALAESS